jgi:hypothetical protein
VLTVTDGLDPQLIKLWKMTKLVAFTFVHDVDAYVNIWVGMNLHLLVIQLA